MVGKSIAKKVEGAGARFASVDALRGLTVAAMLLVNNPGDWGHVYWPLKHAGWHGCTPTDLIFPFFLFIVGVSIALGLPGEAGDRCGALSRGVLVRAARIVALGLALHVMAFVLMNLEWFRPWGVLQRIGVCYAVVGLLALWAGPRLQWTVAGVLLAGYALALVIGGVDPLTNPASRLDAAMLGPLAYQYDPATGLGHEPEGLLSTLPAIATTLIGLRAGVWLRDGRQRLLWLAGAACVIVGALWSLWLPLNKNLWTPSYAVFTAGWAMLALGAAHVLIDRKGWPAIGRDFGRNAIVAYAGSAAMVILFSGLGVWGGVFHYGFRWMTPTTGPYLPSLAFALASVALWAVIVHVMGRMGWRIRI